ncbi:translocon subunit [Mucor velutinosus]|uniref:Translocon subunit n=1 Tax=Mucor velutinosus TaxID=708070 RepID=A0AAN7DQV9_9FUNG|nr:translocon subunit [Mucor velutinosus]
MCYTYYNASYPPERGPLQTNYWRLTADVAGFVREIQVAYNPRLERSNFIEFVQDLVAPWDIYIDSIVVPSNRMGSCFNYKIKDQTQYKAAAAMSSIQHDLYDPNRGATGTIILDQKRMDKVKRESDSGYSSNSSNSTNGY